MNYPTPSFEHKIYSSLALLSRLSPDKKWVFTNGCFDILHRGHVTYLAQARTLGDGLIVALNSDNSVRRLGKAKNRPINPLQARMAVIAALADVDYVVSFDEDTPLNLIELLKPAVLVKGGDWLPENIVGAQQTQARGGDVYSIPFLYNTSTTATVARIRGES